ncbi:MAG: ribonuclease E/G, partial [bacterium]|nr:ribonuclease E/G [bacterium]
MERLLITQREQVLWTVLLSTESKRPIQIQLQPLEAAPLLRQVRVARVRDVVKNIHAAFVDLGDGMQGFYSLEDNPAHLFSQPRTETASSVFSKRPLRSGDEILVQVEKEAIKTKDPVVTSHIQLSGRFCVLTAGKTGLGISAKISDKEWKAEARERLLPYLSNDWGFILRTQAREASFEEIEGEMKDLSERFRQLIEKGRYSTCYSVLYQEPPTYLSGLRDLNLQKVAEIVTDLPQVYEKMQETLRLTQPEALS